MLKMEISKLVHRADIDLPLRIGFKPSSTMYYKTYPYKIVVPNVQPTYHTLRFSFIKNKDQQSPEIHKIRNMLRSMELYVKSLGLTYKKEYMLRREKTVNFFFKEQEHVEKFAKEFQEDIIEIWGPTNATQKQHMMDDEQVVFKNKLWHNKFRWKLTYMGTKHFRDMDSSTIYDYIRRTNPQDFHMSPNFRRAVGLKKSNKNNIIYNWSVCSIYCINQEDTLFLKLATHETLHKVERCITFDEVKDK